ncbi:MAG: hypothetical protein KF905_16755 [Flavobacteriales bacterium]|nr:hypothetical protein [Flavobacteriales bacterium]
MPYIAGGAALTLWGFHQRRGDHAFLLRHVPHARQAMAVEYAVMLLPVVVVLLAGGAWKWAPVVAALVLMAWLPVVQGGGVRGIWLRPLVPAQFFEWKSFVQHTHPFGLLLWTAALAFCWLPVLPLFLLGIIALMLASAQEHCEPRAMLLATAADARSLLRIKVRSAVRLMTVILLPVLVAVTIFQPDWWWIHALFGVGMVVLVAYAIVLKYANYRPNNRLEANGANVSVAALFAILPGLSLVPLVMLLTEWPKARANLNAYFHAHHH